jgi:FMN phosphatase YigB (HAD superfamily)
MDSYQVVLFDMFDTLVNFSRALLPLIRLDGQEVRSTSLCVYEAMRPIAGHVPPEAFARAFLQSYHEVEAIFVGDTPESDVLGAQALGMDVIWIDHGTAALPPGTPAPTHTVASFVEVADLLAGG